MLLEPRTVDALTAELSAHLAAELAELIDDAQRSAAGAGDKHHPRVRQGPEAVH